jgi:hypothetical protein
VEPNQVANVDNSGARTSCQDQPRRLLRRADPLRWIRRRPAAGHLQLVHHLAGPYELERIDILLDGVEVGRLSYDACAQCQQARVGKLFVDNDHEGLGLATRALRAALARTPGYDWWTTPQYDWAKEVVPKFVELRWRPGGDQAALTVSF